MAAQPITELKLEDLLDAYKGLVELDLGCQVGGNALDRESEAGLKASRAELERRLDVYDAIVELLGPEAKDAPVAALRRKLDELASGEAECPGDGRCGFENCGHSGGGALDPDDLGD